MELVLLDIIPLWGIRDPFSAGSHLLGIGASAAALYLLMRRGIGVGLSRGAVARLAAYAASMMLVFTASTLFHYTPEEVVLLKKLDHAAIFLFIGGTCTAVYGALPARWALVLIGAIWTVITAALVVKWVVWPMPLWMSAAMYSALGVMAGSGAPAFARRTRRGDLRPLLLGGAFFLIGALIFAMEQPVLWAGVIEGHEIFHVLVLIASGMHFRFIYRHCTSPGGLCLSEAPDIAPRMQEAPAFAARTSS